MESLESYGRERERERERDLFVRVVDCGRGNSYTIDQNYFQGTKFGKLKTNEYNFNFFYNL
jgi:hypothetical protein